MYLLFLSKYFVYAFVWGSFTHNGDGKVLSLCLYPIKYLNESLPYDFLSDNFILSLSTSLILMELLFLWKSLLMMPFSLKQTATCYMFYTMKRKKSQNFLFYFVSLAVIFFDILLVLFLFFRHIMVTVSSIFLVSLNQSLSYWSCH